MQQNQYSSVPCQSCTGAGYQDCGWREMCWKQKKVLNLRIPETKQRLIPIRPSSFAEMSLWERLARFYGCKF